MTRPQRIQRRRTKGYRLPSDAIYVGRPTRWGNHYIIGQPHPSHRRPMSAEEAVVLYRSFTTTYPQFAEAARDQLRGKDLACWCKLPEPCHADVLLEIANR